jgi:hypothetical protein
LVSSVREYINSINGFKTVLVINRERNYGVDKNIIEGIRYLTNNYQSFIIVEDDLIVSEHFLYFLNSALKFYNDNNKIITISAFNYVSIPKNYKWDCFFTGRTNPWGWASWSNRFKNIDWDISDHESFINNKSIQRKFNFWGSDRSRMLKKTLSGKIRAWDIRLEYHVFKNNLLTAYSTKNLVFNNGFNCNEATNTTGYNRFKVKIQLLDSTNIKFPDFITDNLVIRRRFIEKNSILNRIKTTIYKNLKINSLW